MPRLGIVGVGSWGLMHVRAYSQHPAAELVGICDLDEGRARQVAGQFGVPQVFTSVNKLLDQDLDGISVATPDTAHTEIVLRAAERGIHVLVEKPLATTIAECQAMVDAAERARIFLMVDWHNRWNPPFYQARQAIASGELGQVRYLYYRLSDTIYVPTRMLPWAARSSVMWFLGSHALDTTCWLLGQRPVRIYCQKRTGVLTGQEINTPDFYITMLDFADGAMAVIENSWIIPQTAPALIDHKCEILGTRGAAYLDLTHHRSLVKYTPQTRDGFPNPAFPDMFVTPEVYDQQKGFAVESIYHFVECIRDHKPPLATGRDGLLNTQLILAAEESARQNQPLELTQ